MWRFSWNYVKSEKSRGLRNEPWGTQTPDRAERATCREDSGPATSEVGSRAGEGGSIEAMAREGSSPLDTLLWLNLSTGSRPNQPLSTAAPPLPWLIMRSGLPLFLLELQ